MPKLYKNSAYLNFSNIAQKKIVVDFEPYFTLVQSCQSGGGGGIRTHGTFAGTLDFESSAFDLSSHPSVYM